ncbi:hypothetical protein [Bacteroides sp. UBA939]|uniref:hypothetical protein n=1 Tax=Bacteroides sp. UBA939 TaxID=1946092 RepID=UPI0025B8DF3D|nr:hypothetical protein [Bacteroides sp. UBA939]
MELPVLLSLYPMIVSDFRHRRIVLWHLLLFGALQFALDFYRMGATDVFRNFVTNLFILSFMGGILWIYMRLRFGKKNMIGAGDVFFILLLSPHFEYRAFLYFLIISFCLILVAWFIYGSTTDGGIPLVSALGICYSIVLLYQLFQGIIAL